MTAEEEAARPDQSSVGVLPDRRRRTRWREEAESDPIVTKAFKAACAKAGYLGRIQQDLRRSAVQRYVRQGIPERVAMKLTGHKTPSVFDRNDIVWEGDLRDAATKLDAASAGGTRI